MEKFRYKQAQMLLEEAGKSKGKEILKTPIGGKIDFITFGEIIDNIIDLEEFLYTSRPTHVLDEENARIFCDRIIAVRDKIDDILADFGVIDKIDVEDEIKSLSGEYLILTTKSSFKKALTKLAVNPQRIVVAGVPLQIEDMKEINPQIPDNALQSIKKKISHVKNDIIRKMDQFDTQEMLVVVENDKSGEIMAKRAENLYGARVMIRDSLKNTSILEFRKALEKEYNP